jgi:hypothetical protein
VYFFVFHTLDIIEIELFLLHLLTTPGPPNRLVPDNSCAPRAVPLAFFGVYAVGTRGAFLPDWPGVPV